MRLWLGITWIYGGWNKATDAGFLNAASPHYIGAQLNGYLATSPISFILRKMIEHATQVGWMVMLGEFAIGFAVILGISLELAALAGFGMSIILWLTATWSVKPYFLGSDTVYAVMWLALFFGVRASYRGGRAASLIPDLKDRRELLRLGGVAAAAVAASLAGTKFRSKSPTPEAGAAVATLAELPIGGTKTFQAADGSAAVVFRTAAGVFAYSRVCTHQGCIVNYDAKNHVLACPCHGAQFDPTKDGAVVTGPAPTPLAKIKVAIKGDKVVQI